MEQFPNSEKAPLTEEQMISLLNERGIENDEGKEALVKYVENKEKEADLNPDSKRSRLDVALHMAQLYFKTNNYKEYAVESLHELLDETNFDDMPGAEDEIGKLLADMLGSQK